MTKRRLFIARKSLRDHMALHGEIDGLLPNEQITKRVD
jgi:hypothetical protein